MCVKKARLYLFLCMVIIFSGCAKEDVNVKKNDVNFSANMDIVFGENTVVKGIVKKINNSIIEFEVKEPKLTSGMIISVNLSNKEPYSLSLNGMTLEFNEEATKIIRVLKFLLRVYSGETNENIVVDKNEDDMDIFIKDLNTKIKLHDIKHE